MPHLHLRHLEAPAPRLAGEARDRGSFRVLLRLFAGRFLENDLLSGDGDAKVNAATAAAALAAPGAFTLAFLTLAYAGPFLTPSERLLMALAHKYQFIAASMLLTALAAALEWDALALDTRDLAILGPLPVAPSRLLGAKVASLALFVLALAAAVNLVPTLGFPMVWMSLVPIGLLHAAWLTTVHALVTLAAAAVGFLAVLAVRSLVLLASPVRFARLTASVAQFSLVLVLATLFLLSPMIPANVLDEVEHPTRATSTNPAMWLLGVYERLTARGLYADPRLTGPATWKFWEREQLRRQSNLGPEVWAHPLPLHRHEAEARARYRATMPALDQLAARGVVALPLLLGTSGLLCLLAHLAGWRRGQEGSRPGRGPTALFDRLAAAGGGRHPVARATFGFTVRALARGAPQRRSVAGALAVGSALALLLHSQSGAGATLPARPTASLLALEYVPAFFLLGGLRRAFAIPAALEANWVFRFALDGDHAAPAVCGARRAIVATAVLPFFGITGLAHGIAWGAFPMLVHLVVGCAVSLVLVEALLAGFASVPFTRPCVPADARVRWPFQAAALVALASLCGLLEAWALAGPASLFAVVTAAATAAAGVRVAARQWGNDTGRLTFDAPPDSAVQRLDL